MKDFKYVCMKYVTVSDVTKAYTEMIQAVHEAHSALSFCAQWCKHETYKAKPQHFMNVTMA